MLAQTVAYLPPAVHVAVVDPGVGTARRAVAVAAGGSVLVGPDNGLLSWAVAALGGGSEAVQLTNGELWLHPVSATFHGRDIVMSVDRFGNVQLSIPAADAGRLGIGIGSPVIVRCGRRQFTVPYLDTFAAGAPGEIVAFTDSAGLISLAINSGDAAQQLGLPPGAHVRIAQAHGT